MTNPTSYICPKCGSALSFWNYISSEDDPCRCICRTHECLPEIGFGTDAASAFKDWQKKNQLKQLS